MSHIAADRSQQISLLGFAVLPNVFSADEMDEVIRDLDVATLRRSKAGVRHALAHPSVATLASDARLLEIAREYLGNHAAPFNATLFDKSPEANWLVVWHQDTALPLRERVDAKGWGPWSVKDQINYAHAPAPALAQILTLRVHLDDSNRDNGPLRVLPASHEAGVLTDDEIAGFVERVAPIECVVPKGGVVAMKPLIIHASSKCDSIARRRVIHIEYASLMKFEGGVELATV
jgi:ectoine hydroxylase-related dioxygenase (phytanoyl-CoA dioxygenase family)